MIGPKPVAQPGPDRPKTKPPGVSKVLARNSPPEERLTSYSGNPNQVFRIVTQRHPQVAVLVPPHLSIRGSHEVSCL